MAGPVRREAAELVGQRPVEVPRRQHEVDHLAAGTLRSPASDVPRRKRPRRAANAAANASHDSGSDAESACRSVPAPLGEVVGAGLEGRGHVEVGRGAHRSAHLLAHERGGATGRASVVGQAARRRARAGRAPRRRRGGRAARSPGIASASRRAASTATFVISRRRSWTSSSSAASSSARDGSVSSSSDDRELGIGDPAGRVDARHDAEGEVARGRLLRAPRSERASRARSPACGVRASSSRPEPDDRPALAGHRRDVGDGADGGHRRQALARRARAARGALRRACTRARHRSGRRSG